MFNRKGQNIAEYSILIALVIAAAVAMQVYVKRGLQGRVREAVDHTGTVGDVGGAALTLSGQQYEPYYISNELERSADSTITDTGGARGQVTRTITQDKETRTGNETITAPVAQPGG